jgi:hypothetical protein
MTIRSWFYASQGQQQGPYSESQLRDLIGKGVIRADTLVWSEGMAGWQKAGEIPGLSSGSASAPASPGSGRAPSSAGGGLSADFELWPLFGRTLLYGIGLAVVIPAPWTSTSFYSWFVPRIQVPGRPNLEFTGQVGDIWYVFIILGLLDYVPQLISLRGVPLLATVASAFLAWMVLRWIVGNLSSKGQALPIAFEGRPLQYAGWYLLLLFSAISIIGWAWVLTAWMRWICRNIVGTQREITFNATGLEMLWRTLLFGVGCAFLIPIPWLLRWYGCWYVSQFALAERGAYANA